MPLFDALIDECRSRFAEYGWRGTLFRGRVRDVTRALRDEKLERNYDAHYLPLAEKGRVVWAAIAQANDQIFSEGQHDLPCNTIFSTSPYFDARPHHLLRIADQIYKLKETTPADPVLAKVAAVITDEQNGVFNWRLPRKITDGHSAFFTCTMLNRTRMPRRVLEGRLLPIVVAPDTIQSNMVLPLSCWAPGLVDRWHMLQDLTSDSPKLARREVTEEQLAEDDFDARKYPHRVEKADSVVPGASASSITLTAECATVIRDIARKQRFRRDWSIKVGKVGGNWSLDITESAELPDHVCAESQGIRILYPFRSLGAFQGLVIDYRATAMGEGFLFVES